MGRLDIVISNAGWTRVTQFLDFSAGLVEEDWDRCFVYNVKTHLWLMEAAKEQLVANQGVFVSTASVAGVKPSGSSLPYAVTKAAQIHLVKSLAVICGKEGVRVNCVSPGLMLTEWGMKFDESMREVSRSRTVLKKLTGVEVCRILFLSFRIWRVGFGC
jgi:NAD(P)-dependent dehydrogenase (short-subunit alcohol dehydrogenase family)